MRNNTPRLAWVILLISFSVCLLLVISGPLAARWFVAHSATDEPALLRVTGGTMLLLTAGAGDPIAVVDSREIEPGTLIQSDQSSQGSLAFTLNETATGKGKVKKDSIHFVLTASAFDGNTVKSGTATLTFDEKLTDPTTMSGIVKIEINGNTYATNDFGIHYGI